MAANTTITTTTTHHSSTCSTKRKDSSSSSYDSELDEANSMKKAKGNYPYYRKNRDKTPDAIIEEAPLMVLVGVYIQYFILIMFGHLRDFFGKIFKPKDYEHLLAKDGRAALTSDFESFYTRRMYLRISDCWNRPITGVAGATIDLLTRASHDKNKTFQLTGEKQTVLNLGSYNYLGFAENSGHCAEAVEATIHSQGISVCSPHDEAGRLSIHAELERLVAGFVGKEAAILSSMGFATNSCNIPALMGKGLPTTSSHIKALMGKGSLIISDELNHSSLVFGSRISEATIRVYKHNDMEDLENLLKEVISQGQPRTHRPWNKILVIVEGLYSMEGTIVKLPKIVELKKKYKFYLFMDEAHSIGALGPNGRGICDLLGVDPANIDILMGTFTKSFGASGGYIASSKEIITHLRAYSHSLTYAESMSPAVVQQIITSMSIILGRGPDPLEGLRRIKTIQDNAVYFYKALKKMKFIVWGQPGSPIVPLLLFHPSKLSAFSREALKRDLAVVVVGYPATSLVTPRVRFCISASHTKEQLDDALCKISEIGDLLQLKISRQFYR